MLYSRASHGQRSSPLRLTRESPIQCHHLLVRRFWGPWSLVLLFVCACGAFFKRTSSRLLFLVFVFGSVRRFRNYLGNDLNLIHVRSTHARDAILVAPRSCYLCGDIHTSTQEGYCHVVNRRQRFASRYRLVCLARDARGYVVLAIATQAFLMLLTVSFCFRHHR